MQKIQLLSVNTSDDFSSVGTYDRGADVLLIGTRSAFIPTTPSSLSLAISRPVLNCFVRHHAKGDQEAISSARIPHTLA